MGYFLGRGCIYIGERDAAGKFLKVKEVHTPEFEVEVTQERAEHYNSCGSQKVKDLDIPTQTDVKARLVVDSNMVEILELAFAGTAEDTTDLTFSAQAFPAGLAVGDIVPVPGGFNNLDTLTLVDSTNTPVSLVVGTHYTVDLAAGLVTIKSLTGLTQPLKASGEQKADLVMLGIGTDGTKERFIRFSGVNIADDDKPIVVDLYKASVRPTKTMVKNEGNEVNKHEFEVILLADPNAPHTAAFGKYGKYVSV